jgi:hypothetical protein
MRDCTLELDGDVVVERGRIVKESLLPSPAGALA